MADLDAELLALAGGDSSDEEDNVPTKATSKSPAPMNDPSSGSQNHESAPSDSKTPGHAKRSGKKHHKEESEEGEASSVASSPSSLRSASMSESDTDTSPGDVDDDAPMFPIENKYKDEEDRSYILSLPEIKREEILADRAAQHERHVQNKQLRRYIQDRGRKEAKSADKKKRKAGTADLDEGQRKSTRQKTTLGGRKAGETSGAIEAYKRQREQKSRRDEQRRRDLGTRDRRSPEAYSDVDAEGEVDDDWADNRPARRSSTPRDEPPATLIDFEHARVGRNNFAKVCFYPGFEKAITGCFTRISIGPDQSGQNVYRLALIKGFKEGKPYAMEGENGKMFHTNQYARVAVGKSEREWPFLACSNARFTESEFDRYKKTLVADSLPIQTKSYLVGKVNDINQLLNRAWTEEELQQKLVRSGALKSRYSFFERNSINERRQAAIEAGDEAEVARCDQELQALDGPKLAFGTSLTKNKPSTAPKGPTEGERLAALNAANRKANSEAIRKAQMAEKRAERRRKPNPAQASNNHLAPPTGTDDLFEGSDISRGTTPKPAGTNGNDTRKNTPPKSQSPMPLTMPPVVSKPVGTVNGEKKNNGLRLRQKATDDEIIGAMDLGIDIDIDI